MSPNNGLYGLPNTTYMGYKWAGGEGDILMGSAGAHLERNRFFETNRLGSFILGSHSLVGPYH